ncbi:MAG: oxygen-dependent protoporphyrinogen oxidase [Natronomonas sp.]|jgi:oxygen-dependent protoporphyrinogen oxidase
MIAGSRHTNRPTDAPPELDAPVGIVGAGITGLAIHHELAERDVDSVVFEKRPEPGGVVRSIPHDGTVLETGPQRTRLTKTVRTAITAAGVEDSLLTARDKPTHVYREGSLRVIPTTIVEAIRTDLLSWRGKARLLLEPLTGRPRPGESVAEFLERTLGPETATYLGAPLYAGLYGSDPNRMPVEYSLSKALERFDASDSLVKAALRARLRRRDPPPMVTLERGLQSLPVALADRYADSVRLETTVQEILPANSGYRLQTADRSTLVEQVVLTTPASSTASILSDVDSFSANALEQLQYNSLVVVHLEAEAELHGAGCQLPFESPFRTLGITWNDSLFDRERIYTSYLGGAKAPAVVEWSEDRLGRCAAIEFETITGAEAEPINVTRLRPGMPAYDDSWRSLDDVEPPPGITLCANYESRSGIPGRLRQAGQVAEMIADQG